MNNGRAITVGTAVLILNFDLDCSKLNGEILAQMLNNCAGFHENEMK